jgi:hypothetical protein
MIEQGFDRVIFREITLNDLNSLRLQLNKLCDCFELDTIPPYYAESRRTLSESQSDSTSYAAAGSCNDGDLAPEHRHAKIPYI